MKVRAEFDDLVVEGHEEGVMLKIVSKRVGFVVPSERVRDLIEAIRLADRSEGLPTESQNVDSSVEVQGEDIVRRFWRLLRLPDEFVDSPFDFGK